MDGPKGRGMLQPRGGGLTSDCHANAKNTKRPLALPSPHETADQTQSFSGGPQRHTHNRKSLLKNSFLPVQDSPVRSGADGAILARKKKPMCLGQSSRGSNPAPTRLLRRGDGEWVFPGHLPRGQFISGERELRKGDRARTRSSGAILYRAWWRWAKSRAPAFALPVLPRQAELTLPRGGVRPVLTLAVEPRIVEATGCTVRLFGCVSFLFYSTLPAAARAAAAREYSGSPLCSYRAPVSLGRSVRRRQSVGGPRPASVQPRTCRAQAQRPELAPHLILAPAARHRERSVATA